MDPFVFEYGPVAGCCEHGNEHGFIKFCQFLVHQLLASQEGLCFVELNCSVYSQMPHSYVLESCCRVYLSWACAVVTVLSHSVSGCVLVQ